MTKRTVPRPYSIEWRDAEPQPLELPFGTVSIQPLGWGIRVESGKHEPLVVNGGQVRLGWADFTFDGEKWVLGSDFHVKKTTGLGFNNATSKQREKIAAVLLTHVAVWAYDNKKEVARRHLAYVYDRARQCEVSIQELEYALDEYRDRLRKIEAGDMDVSPYLNEGRGIRT